MMIYKNIYLNYINITIQYRVKQVPRTITLFKFCYEFKRRIGKFNYANLFFNLSLPESHVILTAKYQVFFKEKQMWKLRKVQRYS